MIKAKWILDIVWRTKGVGQFSFDTFEAAEVKRYEMEAEWGDRIVKSEVYQQ